MNVELLAVNTKAVLRENVSILVHQLISEEVPVSETQLFRGLCSLLQATSANANGSKWRMKGCSSPARRIIKAV